MRHTQRVWACFWLLAWPFHLVSKERLLCGLVLNSYLTKLDSIKMQQLTCRSWLISPPPPFMDTSNLNKTAWLMSVFCVVWALATPQRYLTLNCKFWSSLMFALKCFVHLTFKMQFSVVNVLVKMTMCGFYLGKWKNTFQISFCSSHYSQYTQANKMCNIQILTVLYCCNFKSNAV